MSQLLVIVASTRTHRAGGAVADWVVADASKRNDLTVDVADLREVNLPLYDEALPPAAGSYELPTTIAWAERVAAADGVLIVSPEYNGSFPAPLKNALDTVLNEWTGKTVGVVGYGFGGGGRMIDHLTPIVPNYNLTAASTDVRVVTPWDRTTEGVFAASDEETAALTAVIDELSIAMAARDEERVEA